MSKLKLRKEVRVFAEAMELKLRVNDYKGGWKNDIPVQLYDRVLEEMEEFGEEFLKEISFSLLDEGADVANMIMMVCDVEGKLDTQKMLVRLRH